MKLFEKVFSAIENSTETGFGLARDVSQQVKDWTVGETWYCVQERTSTATQSGKYCIVSKGSKKDKHLASKTGCGWVALVRI